MRNPVLGRMCVPKVQCRRGSMALARMDQINPLFAGAGQNSLGCHEGGKQQWHIVAELLTKSALEHPAEKLTRGGKTFIGTEGPVGRVLVQGEQSHDIIHQLYPIKGEPIIDRPGEGPAMLPPSSDIARPRHQGSGGLRAEACVHATILEAIDRDYECAVLSNCVEYHFPEFQRVGLEMIKAQGGIFGLVSNCESYIQAIA